VPLSATAETRETGFGRSLVSERIWTHEQDKNIPFPATLRAAEPWRYKKIPVNARDLNRNVAWLT